MAGITAGGLTQQEFDALAKNPQFTDLLRELRGEPPPPLKSERELYLDRVREAHTLEQREAAVAWVMRVFDDMIRHKEQALEVYFLDVLSTKRTREAGLTDAGNGWREVTHIGVEELSVYYIGIILDDSLSTDEEKIRAMIAVSKERMEDPDDPIVDAWQSHYERLWKTIDGEKLRLWTHIVK